MHLNKTFWTNSSEGFQNVDSTIILILEYTGKHSYHKVSDPSKDNRTTVHQAHTVAQITMKTLINRSVLDVGQVCAKMDHKSSDTARS